MFICISSYVIFTIFLFVVCCKELKFLFLVFRTISVCSVRNFAREFVLAVAGDLYLYCLVSFKFCANSRGYNLEAFECVRQKVIVFIWAETSEWQCQLYLGVDRRPYTKSRDSLLALPTSCSSVLLEKITGSQLVKKFPTFYVTRRFIAAFTRAHHLSLP